MDEILKRAIERRDEAIRQVELWERWIKGYEELMDPSLPDAIPPTVSAAVEQVLDIPSALRASSGSGGKLWARNGAAG